jgi:hypothetical protein
MSLMNGIIITTQINVNLSYSVVVVEMPTDSMINYCVTISVKDNMIRHTMATVCIFG